MSSLPSTPDLSFHVDPISGKPERAKTTGTRFMKSQLNPAQSVVHHSLNPGERSGEREAVSSSRTSYATVSSTTGSETPSSNFPERMDEDIPGAFPTDSLMKMKEEEQARIPTPPSAVDEVRHAVKVLGDYAKDYLPASVGAYIGSDKKEQSAEYPSTEEPSGSRVGVGSLPGKVSEPAVAALSEEKAGKRFNVMTIPDSGPMSRANRGAFPPSDKLPTGGVGSLPGTPNEVDIARLPDERQLATDISSIDSHAPQSVAPSQAFPLAKVQPSTRSINPFRNGQFATIPPPKQSSYPERDTLRQQEDVDNSDKEPVVPEGKGEPSRSEVLIGGRGIPVPPGFKEPHATPQQRRDLGQVSRDPSMIPVNGEEVENLLQQEGTTPRTLKYDPVCSEVSSVQMTPNVSSSCDVRPFNVVSPGESPQVARTAPVISVRSNPTNVEKESPTRPAIDENLSSTPETAEEESFPSTSTPTTSGERKSDAAKEVSAADIEAKEKKSKGFFPRLTAFFRRKSSSKGRSRSRTPKSGSATPQKGAERESPAQDVVQAPSGSVVDRLPKDLEQLDVSSDEADRQLLNAELLTAQHVQTAEPPLAAQPHDRPEHHRVHSHPTHSPVIPKHVPAHFDETIGPLPNHVEMRGNKELPSMEKPGGSRVGIGSLPGQQDEVGVAELPDEKVLPLATKSALAPHTPGPMQQAPQQYFQSVPGPGGTNVPSRATDMPSAPGVALGMYGPRDRPVQQPTTGERQPVLTDREVQTEVPRADQLLAESATLTQPRAPDFVRAPGSSLFSSGRARQEEKEREREIESGQRKTIFTAAGPRHETFTHAPVPSSSQDKSIPSQTSSQQPGRAPGYEHSSPVPATMTEPRPSFPETSHQEPLKSTNAPTTTRNAGPGLTTGQSPTLIPSTAMPEQRSVPLGMEHGIAESPVLTPSAHLPDSAHQHPGTQRSVPLGMEPGVADSRPQIPSHTPEYERSKGLGVASLGPRAQPSTEPSESANKSLRDTEPERGGGFFSNLMHDAEEAIYDAGDVARRHVPEAVGEYLPHHPDAPPQSAPSQLQETVVAEQQLQQQPERRDTQRAPAREAAKAPREPVIISEAQRPETSTADRLTQDEPSEPERDARPLETQLRHRTPPETRRDTEPLGSQRAHELQPESIPTALLSTQSSATETRKSIPRPSNDVPTPLEMSSHPSRSSSAEETTRVPLSTKERISGQQSHVIPAVREQYVRSIVNEPGTMVGLGGGTLPGYPCPAALSSLIGERIYDEHMRAAGAPEPAGVSLRTMQGEQTTESQLSTSASRTTAQEPVVTPTPLTFLPQTVAEPLPPATVTTLAGPRESPLRAVASPGSTTIQHGPISELGLPLTPTTGTGKPIMVEPSTAASTSLRSIMNEEGSQTRSTLTSERKVSQVQARLARSPGRSHVGLTSGTAKSFGVDDLGKPLEPEQKEQGRLFNIRDNVQNISHN